MNEIAATIIHPIMQKRLFNLRKRVYETAVKLNADILITDEPVPYAELSAKEFRPVKMGEKWGGLYDCAWLHITGEIPAGLNAKNSLLLFNTLGEGAIYGAEGTPLQGLSIVAGYLDIYSIRLAKQAVEIPTDNFKTGKLDVWIDTGNNGLWGYRYAKSSLKKCEIVRVDERLKEFYFDYLTLYFLYCVEDGDRKKEIEKALDKAYGLYGRNFEAASALLKKLLEEKSDSNMTAYAVGHSHLDLAWLWPVRETRRKAARTFSTALYNVEKYPFYIFGASQAAQFEFVKKDYPALYERIKKAVADGRIEPLGCMWVEPDINMTGGESLIRQIEYGKEFYKREFGYDASICWLPDVFGFSGALPQILKKCGIDSFLTIKLSWNKFNEFPHTTFIWKGIDGSEVLAHMPPEGNYCSDMAAFNLRKAVRRDKDDASIVSAFSVPFGPGDGGGGAGEVHLECMKRELDLKGLPKVKPATSRQFFDTLYKSAAKLPVYSGELYLEAHQGAYTSNPAEKYHNRLCERLMHKLEFLCAAGADDGDLEGLWKKVLFQQFHDILPGTSVDLVHEQSVAEYFEIEKELNEEIKKRLQKTDDLYAINYSPFARREWVKTDDGKWGYADVAAYSSAKLTAKTPPDTLSAGKNYISNGKLRAEFGRGGEIISLTADGKEFSADGLNMLYLYRDKRLWWHASDLDHKYYKRYKRRLRLTSMRTYVDGAAACAEQTYVGDGVKLQQIISLKANGEYIEFDTRFDFDSPYKMLRADFRPRYFGSEAVCDIQFGTIRRSTAKEDFTRFEICAHKFVDVSDDDCGGALLSDSRYGFRAKDGLLSLNLCRGTVFPGRHGGRGSYTLRYAYYPHNGGYDNSVYRNAYNFVYPVETEKGDVPQAIEFPFCADGVILETIKRGNGGTIFRYYESEGKEKRIEIENAENLFITDLNERIISPAPADLTLAPFEIITLLRKG